MPHQLLTMGPSHFSEKARWALDRAQIPYEESCLLPGPHFATFRRLRATTVPILVTGSGDVLRDSTEIVRWIDAQLAPEQRLFRNEQAVALEDRVDETLGVAVRNWIYSWATRYPALLAGSFGRRVSRPKRALLSVYSPLFARILRRRLGIDRKTSSEHLDHLRGVWSGFDAMLADGRRYLAGDHFTAADLALASLGAHAVSAEKYGGGFIPLADRPEDARATTLAMRETPTGAHVLRMYAEHRDARA